MDQLVTNEELASYLQRDLDTATTILLVRAASAIARSYCRWSIGLETTTFVMDGGGGNSLALPTMNLVSVSEVRVDGAAVTDLYAYSRNGTLGMSTLALTFPAGLGNVAVDCVHGYVTIPDDIKLAVLSIAARGYTNPTNLKSAAIGTAVRAWDNSAGVVSQLDLMLLAPYRLPLNP